MSQSKSYKIMISDCHLSAGKIFEGKRNPHEDFLFDDDLVDLVDYYSTDEYGEGTEVELIIGGDFFDYLNIPIKGEFEDAVTSEMAVFKAEAALQGHPKVSRKFREFVSLPGKRITYLMGNHDAELVFSKVREAIIRAWDPSGEFPSKVVKIIHDRDRIVYPEGVEIRHGNQLEAGNEVDLEKPIITSITGEKILNIPWGSIYIIKVVNRLKWERPHLDKIRPIKIFVFFGMILDPIFTIRFAFLTGYYFLKTRVIEVLKGGIGFRKAWRILKEESTVFQDLERDAREILNENKDTRTIIMGHTHLPMDRIYSDGKQYINTGSWTRMINFDFRMLGQQSRRTFAYMEFSEGKARCELRQWVGEHSPHKLFNG